MIKKFLLAVMLIWCATEGMAQSGNLVAPNISIRTDDNSIYIIYDFYSDGTAVIKNVSMEQCFLDVNIPASVKYENKDYQVVKIADNVFYENGMCSLRDPNRIIISNDATPNLIFGNNPYGRAENHPENVELIVSHCITTINEEWKSLFDVIYTPELNTFFQIIDDDGWPQADYEIPYTASGCNLEPFSITKSDITLNVEQSSILTEKDIINASENNDLILKKATIKYSDKQSCPAKIDDEGYTIYNAVNVNRADITEIKPEDLLLETNSKFYPVPNNPDAVISHVRSGNNEKNFSDDYIPCEDNGKKFIPMLGFINTDTLCVECNYNFDCKDDGVFINISIASNANIIGSYGNGNHHSSTNYNWTLKLNKDFNYSIRLTDPYPVFVNKTPIDKSEIKGTTFTWEDRWFEVDGISYNDGLFINYDEKDFKNLTKIYDGESDIKASTFSNVTLYIKQRFNPAINAVDKLSGYMTSLQDKYDIYKPIEIDCSLAFDNPNVGTDKTIKLTITPTDDFYKGLIGGSYSVTLNTKGTITPIQLDDVLEVRDAIYNALGKERNKPYDGSSMLVPNHKTITLDKEDTGLPDNVQVSLSNLQYFGQDGEWKPSAEHGKHTIVMDLELVLNDNDNPNNYCFFRRDNETYYTKNWLYQGEDKYTGEIIPVEITLTEEMFYLTFPKERPFDGTNLVYDHLGKIVNPDNPQMFLANPEYMINGNFQITNALYKSAEVTDPDPNSIILTIKNLSGNYIINNLGDGNTFAISGNITPAELDIQFAPEDFKDNITFQRQYNSEDASAEIKTAKFSKDGHNFIITDAKFVDNSAGNEKQIAVYIELDDNNPNYELKNSTFNISGGKIWDYATIALNNNKFAEGKATIGTDIIATATYNEQNIEGTFTYTPATGTQLTQGTHEITATFNSACDYIESSTQKFIVVVNGSAIIVKGESIQQKDNQTEYCINGVNGLELKYTKISGDINRFKIEIEGEEKLSEAMSDNKGERINDTIIYVNIPSDAKPGIYHGTIQFFGEDVESDKYPFEITVYMPKSIVKYLYHNVIFVDNHENLFSDYQWYKNGEKIDGATRQYYYEKVLDGNYYVVCKTNSGIQLKSCPVEGELSAKLSVSSVKVYPNPAKADIPFNLELVGGNGNYAGTEMLIYNNSGNLVKHITNITDIITLTLPQGNYSGALFFNGEKTGFKIIVK